MRADFRVASTRGLSVVDLGVRETTMIVETLKIELGTETASH